MSLFSKLKSQVNTTKFKVWAIAAGFTLGMATVAAVATMGGAAAAPSSTPDCAVDAAIWCGVSQAGSLANEIAKVKSVYVNGDGHNKYYAIQDMYNYFGMSTSVINGMSTSNVVSGYVSGATNGDVYATINGKNTLVATGAITAGRQNMAGSTTVKYGATTFYTRPTHISFLNGELAALIIMKNGIFQNAILTSCGNPVKATPEKPAYSILKQVRAVGSSAYSSDISVKSDTAVQYQITVSSTGALPADNVTIHDTLPGDITYTSGTLKSNGVTVSAADAAKFFGSGLVTSSIASGSKVIYTFNAVAGSVSATVTTCKAEVLNNEGYITSVGLSGLQSGAKVTTECTPPPATPSLVCESLTLAPGTIATNGDQTYTLVAKGSATNATVTGYAFTFGDNASQTVTTSATSASTTHTYTPGTYTAQVTLMATANGKTYTQTSPGCQVTITVAKPGTLVCDDLTLTAGTAASNGDTPYTLNATAAASNATITGYNFVLGDGSSTTTVTTGASTASTTHTYTPGTHTASVIVDGVINGANVTETAANCSGSITVKPPVVTPPTPVYVCDELTLSPTTHPDAQGNVTYSLTATASATDATITSYNFNFGDASQNTTVTTSDVTANTTHTYAPGTYTAQVTVTVTLSGGTTEQVTANACKAQVVVAAPTCVSPTTGKTYPMGSSECTPPAAPTCTSPTTGKTYPTGSSECQTPVTPLPNTGPGDVIGLFSGATLAGAAFHWMRARRALRR